jgi:hypothetical protein
MDCGVIYVDFYYAENLLLIGIGKGLNDLANYACAVLEVHCHGSQRYKVFSKLKEISLNSVSLKYMIVVYIQFLYVFFKK